MGILKSTSFPEGIAWENRALQYNGLRRVLRRHFKAPFLRFSACVPSVADNRFNMNELSGTSGKRRELTRFNEFRAARTTIPVSTRGPAATTRPSGIFRRSNRRRRNLRTILPSHREGREGVSIGAREISQCTKKICASTPDGGK